MLFLEEPDPVGNAIGEDMLDQVIDNYEDGENYKDAADLLYEISKNMTKIKRHEQAVAMMSQSFSFYLDAEGSDEEIKKLLLDCLETARDLASKNDEYSTRYIEQANKISSSSNVDVDKYTLEAAFGSFTEHLLNRSKNLVESRVPKTGRAAKEKRDFSELKEKISRRLE